VRLHDDRRIFAHGLYSLLERQRSTLEATLTKLQLDHPDIARALQSEAEAWEKCAEAREQLCKYEAIYGSAALASAGPEVQTLTEQLRSKDEELRKTRLELKALQEVCPTSRHLSADTHRLCRNLQPYTLK
jgi:chromosome segregation ATPase